MLSPTEEQLLEFLYACPVGLVECDAAGEIGMMNPHAAQHLLPLAGTRELSNLFDVLEGHAPELRNLATSFKPSVGRICQGHRILVDVGDAGRNGEPQVLACTLVKLGPDRLMATLSDISREVAQEEQLRLADGWFATMVSMSGEYAVVTTSADGVIKTANEAFTRQTGYDSASMLNRPLAQVLNEDVSDDAVDLRTQIETATREGWNLQQNWHRRANGERYWCQRLVVAQAQDGSGAAKSFAVVLREALRQEDAAVDLRRLLTCDHLTGVANRMHFSRVLEHERARWERQRRPVAFVMMDLDHFKRVNDTFGHPTGDMLLCRAAQACRIVVPKQGLLCRLGGEEFGALLPGLDMDGAATVAEAMRRAVAAIEIDAGGRTLTATASLGYATLAETQGSVSALMALADQRLYLAKRDGRDRVHHPMAQAA